MKLIYPWNLSAKTLFFISIILFLFPKSFLWSGLDIVYLDKQESLLEQSWKVGLNLGLKEGLVWGKDLVFTYGPLGYLMTGISNYGSVALIIFFQLFIIANATYFIWHLLTRVNTFIALFFLLCMLTLNGQFLFDMDSMTLFFFFIFHAYLWYREKKVTSLMIAMAISILSLFIKVNSGIIINIFFIILLIGSFLTQVISRYLNVLLLIVQITMIFFLADIFNVDLSHYLTNSIDIIKGYNDAMYFPSRIFPLLCCSLMLLIFLWPYARHFSSLFMSTRELVLAALTVLYMLLLFKQGFVRADGHINTFITGAPFVVGLAFMQATAARLKNALFLSAISVGCLSLLVYEGSRVDVIKKNIAYKYFFHPAQKPPMSYEEASRLPGAFKNQVKGSSVDVVGCLISHAYYNDLTYNPRPVFQSYSAYTPRLLAINAQKYQGSNGPDFVLFHFGSIDNRHPFWDDARLHLPLMTNYQIIDTLSDLPLGVEFLVFKKVMGNHQVTEHVLLDTTIQINTEVRIPKSDKLLYLEMDCQETLIGKILKFLYQPSEVKISLTDAAGSSDSYRMILPVMQAGVPINYKVIHKEDAYRFFSSKGKDGIDMRSFMVKGNEIFLKEEMRARFVEYDIAPTKEINSHE